MSESIFIKGLRVKYISRKDDKYANTISYFKVSDPCIEKKLKMVNKLSDNLYRPFWNTDKNEVMLKVKTEKVCRKDLMRKDVYEVDIQLVPFFVDNKKTELKGYSAKILKALDVKNDVFESEEEED